MHPTVQHRGLEWLNQAQNTASRKQPAAREGGKPQSKNKLKEQGAPGHRAQGCQAGVERGEAECGGCQTEEARKKAASNVIY